MRSALVWAGLVVLVAFGVLSSVGRALTIADVAWVTRARIAATSAIYPQHAAEIPRIEEHFARSADIILVHVVTGAVFLSLGLLQFSARFRNRHRQFHRWSGRLLVGLAILAGVSGIWLGVVDPYSSGERLPTAGAGALFLIAPAVAIRAVGRGHVARHREWMIRFFAVGTGIVVIRLAGPLLIWLLNPVMFRDVIGLTFWTGFVVSVGVAEVWIRATRGAATLAPPSPVATA